MAVSLLIGQKQLIFGRISAKMNVPQKKLAVLNQLSLENEPISLNELVLKLNSAFAERTFPQKVLKLLNKFVVLFMSEFQ